MSICFRLSSHFRSSQRKTPASIPGIVDIFLPALLVENEVEILVQVNGKPKARIMMPADADAAAMEKIARADAAVQGAIAGKNVVKVICVPKRLVNLVVK